MHTYMHTHMHTYTYMHTHAHAHKHAHTCTHTEVSVFCMCIYIHWPADSQVLCTLTACSSLIFHLTCTSYNTLTASPSRRSTHLWSCLSLLWPTKMIWISTIPCCNHDNSYDVRAVWCHNTNLSGTLHPLIHMIKTCSVSDVIHNEDTLKTKQRGWFSW